MDVTLKFLNLWNEACCFQWGFYGKPTRRRNPRRTSHHADGRGRKIFTCLLAVKEDQESCSEHPGRRNTCSCWWYWQCHISVLPRLWTYHRKGHTAHLTCDVCHRQLLPCGCHHVLQVSDREMTETRNKRHQRTYPEQKDPTYPVLSYKGKAGRHIFCGASESTEGWTVEAWGVTYKEKEKGHTFFFCNVFLTECFLTKDTWTCCINCIFLAGYVLSFKRGEIVIQVVFIWMRHPDS